MNSKIAVEKIMKILGLTSQSFYEAKTEQGMMVKMEGELEVGAPIYIATEEGMIPAPAGTHKLDDGTEIEVDEEGKVSKIKMGQTPDAKMEEKKEEEDIKEDSMASQEKFADVKLKDGSTIRIETYNSEESLIVGRRLKKVGYDGTLSAIADGEYETSSGDVLQIVGGAIAGVQSVADNNKRKTGFVMAKSYDGATLESPTFDVGEDVMVVDADGKKTPAPDGEHQVKLKDSEGNEVKIRVMTKDGKITERSNVEMGDEEMSSQQIEIISDLFAQALKKFEVKIDAMMEKQKELESKFQKFSKEPAGSRVFTHKTINEETNPQNSKLEGFKRLRAELVNK